MAKITTDYNGKPIPEGYVLVPFEYNPLEFDADGIISANIRTITVDRKVFKVVYKAVPLEWAAWAKSQFNLVENEELGHYYSPNRLSLDGDVHQFEEAFLSTASPEEAKIKAEEKAEKIDAFIETMKKLINLSPQLGLATTLDLLGKKGEEFAAEMGVTHNKANDYHNKAHELIEQGLQNIDFETLRTRRSPRHDEYLEKAYKLLDILIEMLP